MGAQTFGSDVSGPATAAAPPLRARNEASKQAVALQGEPIAEGHGRRTDCALLQADREDLENLCRDFGALGLAPPMLVEADVGDEKSRVRRPR